MASIISIKLNLVPGGSPGGILPRVRVSQGDAEDRIIQFELFDGLTPADMSDVDQCYIGGMKPDGNGFTVSCTVTSNVATAILTDQATVLAGEIRCKLYLLSATGSVRSAPFTLDVDPDPLADAGTSDTDITAIVQAAAMYANNASESAQEAAQAATGAATAGATAGQAAAEAVVNNKLDKSTAAEAWASGVEYVSGQYRLYTDGHLYKCILDHTSSSSITPEDTTYWEDTTIADEITSCNSNYTNLLVCTQTQVNLPARTNGSHMEVTAPTKAGYAFICWISATSKGWVGNVYFSDNTSATTSIWSANYGYTDSYAGTVLLTALYKKIQ